MDRNQQVAEHLMAEHAGGRRFTPFAAGSGIADLDGAYAAQDAFVGRLRRGSTARPAGYKVGLTSRRMQAMCGIDTPVGGVILDGRVHESGVRLSLSDHGRLGLEFEICVIAGKDLPPIGRDYSEAEAAAAVGSVAAAVEMVDDRGCDYATLDVLSLVADNSWNAGVVLGDKGLIESDVSISVAE